MKILLLGKNGQVGWELQRALQPLGQVVALDRTQNEEGLSGDLADFDAITQAIHVIDPDVVINAAAYTAVDKAEDDQENAFLVNAKATEFLAKISNVKNIPFIHVSTDYVFDGTESVPRLETDQTNPIGVYGQTKLDGENLALANNPKTIILRTAWVYSRFGNNFVKTMLRLFNDKDSISVVADQIGSPTNAIDLANAILEIVSKDELVYGIYNYSNEGECSWFEFAQKIKEFSGSSIEINPVPTSAYPTKAKRPAYSLLDKSKIKEVYQLEIPAWEDSLKEELKHLI